MLWFELFTGMAGLFMAGGALIPLLMGDAFPVVLFAVGAGLLAAGCFYGVAYANLSNGWEVVCMLLTVSLLTFAALYWMDTLLLVTGNFGAFCRIAVRKYFASFWS